MRKPASVLIALIAVGSASMFVSLGTTACAQLLGLSDFDEGDFPDSTATGDAAGIDGQPDESATANGEDPCTNDVQDGDETDVNCGGSSCGKCAQGQKCKGDSDCPKSCVGNHCSGCAGTALDAGPGFDGGLACIDVNEVRVSEYNEFVLQGPKRFARDDTRCFVANAPNAISAPDNFSDQLTHPDHPVRFVDWCTARAYCKWRGKHLCAGFGGQRVALDKFDDPTLDQWMAACTGSKRTQYPYDGPYSDKRCNGIDQNLGGPWDVNHLDCKTLDPIITYDMSGNVAEWEDACDDRDDRDQCLIRGGSFMSDAGDLRCGALKIQPRTTRSADVGFRCCE